MGFKEVYLIGIDFNFTLGKVTNINSVSGQIIESEGESNHFHKDYRKPGETWTMPMLEEQTIAFYFAEYQYSNNGRKLLNASRITKLTSIPLVNFDDVFRIEK